MQKRPAPKKLSALEKKVQPNPRYAHVEARLDTGLTTQKVRFMTSKEYARRRDETFYRVTSAQMQELYEAYQASEAEDIFESERKDGLNIVTHAEDAVPEYDKPYLILDVRSVEEYQACHLMHARSFPVQMLHQGRLHPEIYEFRNQAGKLIIIYDNDERLSREVCTALADRGTENVFMLTGGLVKFGVDCPSYCEGEPPQPIVATPQGKTRRSNPRSPSDTMSTVSRFSKPGSASPTSTYKSTATGRSHGRFRSGDTVSEAGSMMSQLTVAESVISKSVARKGRI